VNGQGRKKTGKGVHQLHVGSDGWVKRRISGP